MKVFAMAIWVAEDRSLSVKPGQCVRTAWIDIDLCKLANRSRMSPEAVQKKYQKLLCMGDNCSWPPIVGQWDGERFNVYDGRHEYLASLMLGRTKLLVGWLEDVESAS
jgi:hypothetical protein